MTAGGTVLIVEDDEQIRTFITDLVEDEGHTAMAVADGRMAIRMLREHHPPPASLCLVILDLMLPEVDGIEVLRTLAQLGGYVPVVAMSADHDYLLRAADAGANETLRKPFKVEQLLAVIERLCGKGHSPSATSR